MADEQVASVLSMGALRLEAVVRPGGVAGKLVFYAYEHDRFLFCVPEPAARAFADFVMSVPWSR